MTFGSNYTRQLCFQRRVAARDKQVTTTGETWGRGGAGRREAVGEGWGRGGVGEVSDGGKAGEEEDHLTPDN